jgi:hypothetical protein
MGKVNKEVAQAEFDRWFENKKLRSSRREGDAEELMNEIVLAIQDGDIVITDDFEAIQNLKFPITQPVEITQLKFVARIQTGTLMQKTASVKQGDSQGRSIATIAALTNEVGGTIRALDSVDFALAACISAFY